MNDYIIMEKKAKEVITEGGIALPDSVIKNPDNEAVVISVGPGKLNDDGTVIPSRFKEGDRLIHSAFGPFKMFIEGKEYIVAREGDIVAIVSNAEIT